MARWPRSARQATQFAWIIALALIMTFTSASQENSIRVVGSGIALPLVEDLAATAEQELTIDVTGTAQGLEAFCSGDASMVAVPRAINGSEDALCAENNIEYSELLLANDVLAVITNPNSNIPTCLTTEDIDTLLAPSATGRVTDWTGLVTQGEGAEAEVPALAVYLPNSNTRTYALLDQVVSGAGLRSDATLSDAEDIISAVAENEGAIGVVPLNIAQASDGVNILNIDTIATGAGCVAPAAETAESDTYTYSQSILLYVENSTRDELSGFLTQITSEDVTETVTSSGFVPVSANARTINEAIIAGESEDGRQFTTAQTSFQVPSTLIGEVAISGTGTGYSYVNNILSPLASAQTELNLNYQIEGNTAGIRRLCNGESDIVITTTALDEDQAAACEANEIVPIDLTLGTQATVLVANASDEFASCLTTDQISALWAVTGDETTTNWNQVDASFPDQDIMLFGPALGNVYSDILLQHNTPILPLRADTETSADPLYRAAATANVPGALTYMNWADYQRVVGNDQANIQLVAVDNGDGCIVPSEESITSGEYPLTLTTHIIAAQSSLNDVNVQSILWTMFEDSNLSALQSNGYVGITGNALPAIRQELEREFEVSGDLAQAALESETSETDDETSEETTDESTETEAEATEEVTEEAGEDTSDEADDEAATEVESAEGATEEPTSETESDS